MRIALIADVFPPLRSSGAVQLRDLSRALASQGHEVTVLVAAPELEEDWRVEAWSDASVRGLDNVVFFDEIDPDEIPGLYAQCHVGLVALDPRHKTHNIPGKFLSYMQCGLPVLAHINPGNDLVELIEKEQVGRVCTDTSIESLRHFALELSNDMAPAEGIKNRCKALAARLFSPEVAVKQIVEALQA
jgi:glycosyltransferase involved in cell wall biosynthesis